MAFVKLQPILFVANVAAEKEFYLALGLPLIHEIDGFAGFQTGDLLFGIQHSDAANSAEFNRQLNWQIGVDNVRTIEQRCQAANLDVVQPPQLQDWGEWIIKVRSPNGIIVSFEGASSNAVP